MERLRAKVRTVCGMIELHAAVAESAARDQGEGFAMSARFSLSEVLWGHSRILPLLVDVLCSGVSEKVSFAVSLALAAQSADQS